jgi:hypothetical protein
VRSFAIDNRPLERLGLAFDADWRATVRAVIDAHGTQLAAA